MDGGGEVTDRRSKRESQADHLNYRALSNGSAHAGGAGNHPFAWNVERDPGRDEFLCLELAPLDGSRCGRGR